jgi:DNA-binding NarL/FixJ family response regulator
MDLFICFIDDSEFEHDLVKNEIAPFAHGIEFFQAYTFEEAVETLGGKIPLLFLLDLWGRDMDVETPILTPREEIEEKISRFKSLHEVYDGLEHFEGDRTNEYLKRLFSIVDSWRNLFEEACDRIGQNRKYGLANIGLVREIYPGIPAVFYTRKSLISDAVAMFQAGADGLFVKPTGRDDRETRKLTHQYAPKLIEELSLIIDRHILLLKTHEGFYQTNLPGKTSVVGNLIRAWHQIRNN